MNCLALLNMGPWEVVFIAGVALLLFGKRLPEIGRAAGRAVSSFKQGMREGEEGTVEPAPVTVKSEEAAKGKAAV